MLILQFQLLSRSHNPFSIRCYNLSKIGIVVRLFDDITINLHTNFGKVTYLQTNIVLVFFAFIFISNVVPMRFTSSNMAVRQRSDLLFIAASFWFEESPCAVRTNTAGLGRLCTLFAWSTMLVFEHMHDVLSSTHVMCCTMVTTKHCCYGACMSNSRYADTEKRVFDPIFETALGWSQSRTMSECLRT